MAALMSHVEHLSETIGPRPATSDGEARAAEYIRDVFESRGLDVESQSFDTPTTYSWAYVLYHVLTIAAAVMSHWFPLPALILGALVAVGLFMDLDTRFGLTALMPKRLSQNLIARHEPKVSRGERVARVVVVAHYDSARSSLAFSPSMVRNFATTFGLMKWCTYVVPLLIGLRMLPFVDRLEPYTWYVTLIPAAYLLVPAIINVHRELFMGFVDGANDNASGVAAMLGVLEHLVPEPDAATFVAREKAKVRTEQEALDADVVPAGALLSYSPVSAPPRPNLDAWTDDDVSWDTGRIPSGQTELGLEAPSRSEGRGPVSTPATDSLDEQDEQTARLFGTGPLMPRPAAQRPAPEHWDADEDEPPAPRRAEPGLLDVDEDLFSGRTDEPTRPEPPAPGMPGPRSPEVPEKRRGLFGRASTRGDRHGVRDWLGVGEDFEPRKAGKDIGSWDALSDEDEDESGWKGGTASIEGLDDPDFAAHEAARIRRRVTTQTDRDLVEKEVWFVATGAEEVGTVGMKAFLKEFGSELKDAVFINLDNLGSGSLCYVTREGMGRRVDADRRLVGAAKRAAREAELPIKGCEYHGLSTDATPALVRGFRAMSVMAFDINGRLPNWHWRTDVADEVSPSNIETAVEFVTAIIKTL